MTLRSEEKKMEKIVIQRTNQKLWLFGALAFTMLTGSSCSKIAKMVFKPKDSTPNVNSKANEIVSGDKTRKEPVNAVVDEEELTGSAKEYFTDGKKLLGREDYQGAVKSLSRAIKKDPKMTEAYFMRGLASALLQKFTSAIDDFSIVLEREPKRIEAYSARGNAYVQSKSYQKAIDDFDKVLAVDKNNSHDYTLRGMAHAEMKSYNKALNDINQAIKLSPKEIKNYKARMLLADKAAGYSIIDAVSDLEKVSELEREQSKSRKSP